MRRRRALLTLLAAGLVASVAGSSGVAAAPAAPAAHAQVQPAAINGAGSTYVQPAMDQWIAEATSLGLNVNYSPGQGSPQGLRMYSQRTIDFAGTEAEFASLGDLNDASVTRGFQYIPDVAGAVAIFYNVDDQAGRPVDYLRLSRSTVAKIFMGYITHWDDPAITNDLGGQITLPHEPIKVVYRSSPSGTTALFYDFIQNTEPALYDDWVARNALPNRNRIIELPPTFAPLVDPRGGSYEVAAAIGANKWSIGYDEFGYFKVTTAEVAWIQNQAGRWVKPFAANITAALELAQLRPNLSQELSQVYTNPNPGAYPISAYSYIVAQCAPASDAAGAQCRGDYANAGVSLTLKQFLMHVACDGQKEMANIGFAPLPPQLSQYVADAVHRMSGEPLVTLTQQNCGNPRFDPNYLLPGGEQPPPLPDPPGVDNLGTASSRRSTAATGPGSTAGAADTAATAGAADAAGRTGNRAVGGGSEDWREAHPVAYDRPTTLPIGMLPWVALVMILAVPVVGGVVYNTLRRRP
jgi:phosphate transport system substrate-binding protein